MKIYGTITDAAKERPLAKAKVVLYVGETELVTFYSDTEGKFEVEQELDQHIGESLVCRVEKAAFKPREASHRIGHEDIRLDIELVPVKEEKTEEVTEQKPDIETTPKSSVSPPGRKWPKIAIGIVGVIVVAVIAYSLIPKHETKTFRDPKYKGYRLDWCFNWGAGCGEAAATAWCRSKGYDRAIKWAIDKDIGTVSPTRVFNTRQVCRDASCDGFLYITCKK